MHFSGNLLGVKMVSCNVFVRFCKFVRMWEWRRCLETPLTFSSNLPRWVSSYCVCGHLMAGSAALQTSKYFASLSNINLAGFQIFWLSFKYYCMVSNVLTGFLNILASISDLTNEVLLKSELSKSRIKYYNRIQKKILQ